MVCMPVWARPSVASRALVPLLLLVSVTRTAVADADGFEPCDTDSLYAETNVHQYEAHVYTRRGFKDMQMVMPNTLNLTEVLTGHPPGTFNVLEQGCGSSRGLLEAQTRFPSVSFYGVNFAGYTGFGQVGENKSDIISVAAFFSMPLMCTVDGDPVLPTIRLTPSIADTDFKYPFPNEFFNLIVSRDALNSMKIWAHQSHVYITKMLKVLKPGGMAAVHLDYGANYVYPQLADRNFTVIGIFSTPKGDVSFMVYKKNDHETLTPLFTDADRGKNFYLSYFGLVFKRCLPTDLRTQYGDCILPKDYEVPYPDDLQIWKEDMGDESLVPKDRPEAKQHRIVYSFHYMRNLLARLGTSQKFGLNTLMQAD